MSNHLKGVFGRLSHIHEIFIRFTHDSRPKHPFVVKKLRYSLLLNFLKLINSNI